MNLTILKFDEINSTNTEAINQAKRGADEGLCIVARSQTDGRGRHGRTWISEKDAGLYFSIVLRPKIETQFLPLLTLMSAIAVHDVLSEVYGLQPDIKWANDVLVNDKKICGILAETVETNKGLAVIVGIGINLKSSNFPPQITATSIEEEAILAVNFDEVHEALTRFFAYHYNNFNAGNVCREWTKRSTYAFGKDVRIVINDEVIFGMTRGIEENGALRIETDGGKLQIIHAGDVEQLRQI
jgi:BirA family transcriptional regulator, biotin operon repressor / biotin---[acetyl-CoA-carboxylase] ligase